MHSYGLVGSVDVSRVPEDIRVSGYSTVLHGAVLATAALDHVTDTAAVAIRVGLGNWPVELREMSAVLDGDKVINLDFILTLTFC